MSNSSSIKAALKEFSLSSGLYRPGNLSRWFDRAYRAKINQEISFFSQLLDSNSLCFDVGANIGEKSEVLLRSGVSVVAFEPQPNCVKELKARCRPYLNHLRICQSAVGSEPGEAELYCSKHSFVSSFINDWSDGATSKIPVIVTTLDNAIAEFGKPSYCKIDVEGWEYEVLKGLTQAISLISIEYHMGEREISIVQDCLSYLSRFGDMKINITPAEKLVFTFQEWVSLKKFLELFPDIFRDQYEYRYGDIFIRIYP